MTVSLTFIVVQRSKPLKNKLILKLRLQRNFAHNRKDKIKEEIDKLFSECINLSSEKVAIADKTYFIADSAVRDLDDDLKKFEETLRSSVAPDKKRLMVQPLSKYQKDRRKKIHQEIEMSKEIFQLGAGQTEPLYCFCSKPSYGQMIMCDNQLCDKEWFHLECVKLKDFPTEGTNWFCSMDCKKESRQRTLRLQQKSDQK